MSAWEEMTEKVTAFQQQVQAIALRTGVEPVTGLTAVDAVAAIEEAANGECLFRDWMSKHLEEGMDVNEALARALRQVKLEAAERGFRAYARHVFQDGWDPSTVMRRMYATVTQTAPELCPATIAEQASLFGETRSATDGRQRKMFRPTGVRGRHQKKEGSVERMRRSARGNTNRRNGEKKRRVLAMGAKGSTAGK